METAVIQFGKPAGAFKTRPGAYGVVRNSHGQFLVLEVNGFFHLPGGGIHAGEDPKAALVRELMEEAGCTVGELTFLGRANQFFDRPTNSTNKEGVFFTATMVTQDSSLRTETSHVPRWFSFDQVQASPMGDFQKWAIRQVNA